MLLLYSIPLWLLFCVLCCDADHCRRGCRVGEQSERGDGDFEVMYCMLFFFFFFFIAYYIRAYGDDIPILINIKRCVYTGYVYMYKS